VGDIVVEIDGKKIKNGQDVVREVLKKKVGQKIELDVIREGKQIKVEVTTTEMPAEAGERRAPSVMKEWFGLRVTAVTPDIARELGLPRPEGVVIENVEAGSVGQDAGLRRGDVILQVNRQKVRDESDYRTLMEKTKPEQTVLLLVRRGSSTFFVSLKEEK
jgi:serine protease Do